VCTCGSEGDCSTGACFYASCTTAVHASWKLMLVCTCMFTASLVESEKSGASWWVLRAEACTMSRWRCQRHALLQCSCVCAVEGLLSTCMDHCYDLSDCDTIISCLPQRCVCTCEVCSSVNAFVSIEGVCALSYDDCKLQRSTALASKNVTPNLISLGRATLAAAVIIAVIAIAFVFRPLLSHTLIRRYEPV
jgi:hypothetical protein